MSILQCGRPASALRVPEGGWRCFAPDKCPRYLSKGFLTSLELDAKYGLDQGTLEIWSQHTDFAVLRMLKMYCDASADALEWAAAHCNFAALTSLTIALREKYRQRNTPAPFDEELHYQLNRFLQSLPPLTQLDLSGDFSCSTFRIVIEQHGKTLQSLRLEPTERTKFTSGEVESLVRHCPGLEDLTLIVERSKGNAREASIYRNLGTLLRLQNITLILNSSDLTVCPDATDSPSRPDIEDEAFDDFKCHSANDPSFDEFDQQFFPISNPVYWVGSCHDTVIYAMALSIALLMKSWLEQSTKGWLMPNRLADFQFRVSNYIQGAGAILATLRTREE